jgi:eukaryotic-like serine/threonine-protein kinase
MADRPAIGYTLSLTAEMRHDRLCDAFEEGWRAGREPRIEDSLQQAPAEERRVLFPKLLRVELAYRPGGVEPAEYQARFPEYADLVDTAFRNPDGETADFIDGDVEATFVPPTIPGYTIEGPNPMGTGGMGVVHRARHIELGRVVAIKFVRAGVWARPQELLRFQLEARSVAGLNHANIVHLYDFGQAGGVPYYVMELVDGGSLAQRLGGRPADPRWAASLVESVARAVQYVHDSGLIHRDLKPANILLTADGTPKVTDFGLAKRLADDGPGLTRSRAVLGTACYMAPEQARGDVKSVGEPADVWGLGAVLYECLTGRPPFHAASYELTILQVLNNDPDPPTSLVPAVPADLEAVCEKCLEKDPARRYASAAEMADELRRFQAGEPVLARPHDIRELADRWADRAGYDIDELVSRWPWAYAFAARQRPINRAVLLKLSAGSVASHQDAALRREAEVLAGLEIPFVIRLHDYGERHGRTYLVLEWVHGGESLAERLRHGDGATGDSDIDLGPGGPAASLSSRNAARLALMTALGLKEVHDRGFLHCGLNPSDIILTQDGEPKLSNFVAARRPGEGGGQDVPFPEWVPPNYLAPELIARDWSRLGPPTDVYALGAILFEMLTGSPPPPAPSALVVATNPPIADPALATICQRCLEPDPARRYAGAGAVALALQHFLIPPRKPQDRDSTVYVEGAGEAPATPRGPPAQFRLRVLSGAEKVGTTIPLLAHLITVGRSDECDLVLNRGVISHTHCGILWNEETRRHEVVDFGSKNGTKLNGQPVKASRPLTPGDQIAVPGFVLVFEIDDLSCG